MSKPKTVESSLCTFHAFSSGMATYVICEFAGTTIMQQQNLFRAGVYENLSWDSAGE